MVVKQLTFHPGVDADSLLLFTLCKYPELLGAEDPFGADSPFEGLDKAEVFFGIPQVDNVTEWLEETNTLCLDCGSNEAPESNRVIDNIYSGEGQLAQSATDRFLAMLDIEVPPVLAQIAKVVSRLDTSNFHQHQIQAIVDISQRKKTVEGRKDITAYNFGATQLKNFILEQTEIYEIATNLGEWGESFKIGPYSVFWASSYHPLLARAARSPMGNNHDIVFIKTDQGNVSIEARQNGDTPPLDLRETLWRIRAAEAIKVGTWNDKVAWEDLLAVRTPLTPNIFAMYNQEGWVQGILNASDKHPGIVPISLSEKAIKGALIQGIEAFLESRQ